MNWKQMTLIEPRLKTLLVKAKSYSPSADFCANRVWYDRGGLKSQLSQLVGWEAADPRLKNSFAYDRAYNKIYAALPDCQHAGRFC